MQNPPLCSRTILTPTGALLREPGSDEGHLEGVGEGVQDVEGLRVHGAHQRESAPLKLNTRTRGFGLFYADLGWQMKDFNCPVIYIFILVVSY